MLRTAPAVAAALVLFAQPALADSLPDVRSGHRPGPDVLYAPAPQAPQLENTGPLEGRADPRLRRAGLPRRRVALPGLPLRRPRRGGRAATPTTRTAPAASCSRRRRARSPTRPTRSTRNNAADLVELRVRPLGRRDRLPRHAQHAEGPGAHRRSRSRSARRQPRAPGRTAPASRRRPSCSSPCTARSAELRRRRDAARPRPGAERRRVDLARRQVDVRVPHAAWDPGTRQGAHDGRRRAVGRRRPAATSRRSPGRRPRPRPAAARPTGAALFNVGPRFDEPLPDVTPARRRARRSPTPRRAPPSQAAWWRERAQADALRLGRRQRASPPTSTSRKLAARTRRRLAACRRPGR